MAPLRPFPIPPKEPVTIEVTEFFGSNEKDAYPFSAFVNHLYIYPLMLNFDSQKLFPRRARNIVVTIELRDSDGDKAKPLECIYGRPGQNNLISQISCPVLHHNTNPVWYEEVKMRLPLAITPQHHLLFSFVHVSCNITKKKEIDPVEAPVGYAWLPLIAKGKLNLDEQTIPVAATLPNGYLSIQPLGLGKGVSDFFFKSHTNTNTTLVMAFISNISYFHLIICHIHPLQIQFISRMQDQTYNGSTTNDHYLRLHFN